MADGKFKKGTKVKWGAYGSRAAGAGTVDGYETEDGKPVVVIKMAGGGEVKMNDGSLVPA